jgi:autotransporter-associated beta strand protein
MKILLRTLLTVAALTLLVNQAAALTYTWTGAAGSTWNTAGNWDIGVYPPNTGTNNDVVIAGTANISAMVASGASYTLRSLTFDASNLGNTEFILSNAKVNTSAGRTLTFNAGVGTNATLTVDASASGTKAIDRTAGGSGSLATIVLTSSLDVVHNGAGLLTLGAASGSPSTCIITGPGGLNKSGSGTLFLPAINTYSGPTTISGGILQLGNGTSGKDGSIANSLFITNDAALVYNRFGSSSYPGTISGAGTVTKLGVGTQTLAGTNTYNGATTILAGSLVGVVGGSCANSALSVAYNNSSGTAATLGVAITDNTKAWTCASLIVDNYANNILDFNFGSVAPSATVAPLIITGAATFTSPLTVTVEIGAAANVTAGNSYPLMTWGSDGASAPTAVTVTSTTPGATIAAHLAVTGNTNYLVIDSVGLAGALVRWAVTGAGTWDTSSINWTNNLGMPTAYADGNDVVFDETYITANTTVTLDSSVTPASVTVSNATYDYTISGNGNIGDLSPPTALAKSGAAKLTLTTANYYSGPTTISGGTLQLGDGTSGHDGTIGSSLLVTNNGVLVYNRFDSASYAGVISGTGSVTVTGPGSQTLSGNNSYTGGTLINGSSTLIAASANAVGAVGAGTVTNNGTFNMTTSGSYNFNPGLSGTGVVNVSVGTGAQGPSFQGNNSGFTGILNIGVNAPNVPGSGKVTMVGGGIVPPSATAINVYSNATFYTRGGITPPVTLYGGDTGEPYGQLRVRAYVDSNWSGPVTLAGPITSATGGHIGDNDPNRNSISGPIGEINGPQSLVKCGVVTTTLTGTNTYTGDTIIRAGSLTIGGAGKLSSSGSYAGAITFENPSANTNGSTFTYASSAAQTLSGIISGDGTLTASGPGVLTLTAVNTFTNTIITAGGTLQLGDGTSGHDSTIASSPLVTNDGTLVYNRFADSSYGGTLSGSGAVIKLGAATQTLTGNTYTGNTTVAGGTLVLTQPTLGITSAVMVTNGGKLQLDFAGGETNQVGGLVLNGVIQPGGVYSSTTSPTYLAGAGSLLVVAIGTTTTVSSSTNPSTVGQSVTFTATVAPASGSVVPTGSVQFKTNGVALGSPVAVTAGTPPNGTATISTAALPAAGSPHAVTAEFTGIAFTPSVGTLVGGQIVNSLIASNPTNMTYTISGNTLTLTWPEDHLGWYAQSNSVNLANTNFWFDIPNSQLATNLVITVSASQTNVFYRMRYPN